MSVAKRFAQRQPRALPDQAAFENEFALESLKSDQLRVTILIGAITSSLLLVVFLTRFFYDEFQAAFHGRFERFLFAVSIIFGGNVIYLLSERFVLGRLIKKREQTIQVYQVG